MTNSVNFNFSGAAVLIFGGTSGINLGIAHGFARAGATVGVVGRNAEKAEKAASELASHGGKAFHYAADVRSFEAVTAVYEAFKADAGEIDVLISGAAGNFPAPVLGMSPNGFKSVVDIDLLGTFHVLRAGFDYLRKPGANIINISAPQSEVAMPFQAHVCAAKAGVDMLTSTTAQEWGPMGVRVNGVIPGPIDGTEGMARLAPTDEIRKKVETSVPLGRMGDVSDVADVCLFLASDAARYVSGVTMAADGGWLAAGARVPM